MSVPRFAILLSAFAIGLALYRRSRPPVRKSYGSQSNAFDAVDSPELSADATPEEVLDAGIEFTFPASDPVSVESAYRFAARRKNAAASR